jgi:hypothetical protein
MIAEHRDLGMFAAAAALSFQSVGSVVNSSNSPSSLV